MNSQGPQQHSITEAAADWAVRLHAGALTDQEQAELRQWIACDSRHEAALRYAEQTWAALGEVHKDEPAHRQRPSSATLPVRRTPRRRRGNVRRRWRWL
ncbi:FecR/PupR family sigma factor regulator, partial [Pseudomonas cyclaminis]|uniref:FecR/PupR family sigma factor regulator n=1 Tax=Pseudomonas cyclaminis TaxID=2781239 RepID=UPI003CC5173C